MAQRKQIEELQKDKVEQNEQIACLEKEKSEGKSVKKKLEKMQK